MENVNAAVRRELEMLRTFVRRLATLGQFCLVLPLLHITAQARDPNTFSFYSWDRNRTYTITTYEGAVSLQFGGHWLYQPSLILAGPETNNMRVLVFNSNLNAYSDSDQAIWVTSDIYNTMQFPQPTAVLRMSQSSNICDMADARPIWDGSQWHVYVQALLKTPSGSCGDTAVIVKAKGSSLYSLAWDVESGTQAAKVVVAGNPPIGIGEAMQWFFAPSAPLPFVGIFNDWGSPFGGGEAQATYSSSGTAPLTPWYMIDAAWSPYLEQQGYTGTLVLPDVLLTGSLDEGVFGPPGIGAESSCYMYGSEANKYQYSRIGGYYPNPLQTSALNGVHFGLAIRSISYDIYGERTFRPRFGRDSRGFLPLSSSSPTSRTWYTLVVYNPTQINNSSSDPCNKYSRWTSSDQKFAFSHVYITEN